jgi:hypothetical protein
MWDQPNSNQWCPELLKFDNPAERRHHHWAQRTDDKKRLVLSGNDHYLAIILQDVGPEQVPVVFCRTPDVM